MEKVNNRGKRHKTLSKVKPVENVSKNLQKGSPQRKSKRICLVQKDVLLKSL